MKKTTVETMETGELKVILFKLHGVAWNDLTFEEQQLLLIIAKELEKRNA
jgi:hypothetical protein